MLPSFSSTSASPSVIPLASGTNPSRSQGKGAETLANRWPPKVSRHNWSAAAQRAERLMKADGISELPPRKDQRATVRVAALRFLPDRAVMLLM